MCTCICIYVPLKLYAVNCFFSGFNSTDMSRIFQLPATTVIGGEKDHLMLSDILDRLKGVYCTHIGLEYMHINDRAKCKRERERDVYLRRVIY